MMDALRSFRGKVAQRIRGFLFRRFTAEKGRPQAIWLARKAWAQIGKKDWKEAIFFAEAAILCDPTLSSGYLMLGLAYRLSGRTDEARAAFDQGLLSSVPEDFQLYQYLGELETQLRHYPEAESAYRRALEMRPSNPELQYKLAAALEKQDRFEEAIPLLESAIQGDPNNPSISYSLGEARLFAEDARGAVEALTEAIKRGAPWPGAYYYLAVALCNTGQWKQALEPARKAIELEPGRVSYRGFLERLEAAIKQIEEDERSAD